MLKQAIIATGTVLLLPVGFIFGVGITAFAVGMIALASPVLIPALAIAAGISTVNHLTKRIFPTIPYNLNDQNLNSSPMKKVLTLTLGVLFSVLGLIPATLFIAVILAFISIVTIPTIAVGAPFFTMQWLTNKLFSYIEKRIKRHNQPDREPLVENSQELDSYFNQDPNYVLNDAPHHKGNRFFQGGVPKSDINSGAPDPDINPDALDSDINPDALDSDINSDALNSDINSGPNQ